MIVIAGKLTVGIWGNGVFVLVNCAGSLIDIILVSIAISRTWLLCVVVLDGFVMLLSPDTYAHDELMNTSDVLRTTSNHSSIWFSSYLHVVYLLRIVDISHLFFLWLKLKINGVILGILLISFLISLIISTSFTEESCCHFKINYEENATWEFKASKIPNPFKEITLSLGVIVPFILCLISFLLSLCSLLRLQAGENPCCSVRGCSVRDSSTEAHRRTLKGVDHLSAALYCVPCSLSCHNLWLSDSSQKICGDVWLHDYCHFSMKASIHPDNGEQ